MLFPRSIESEQHSALNSLVNEPRGGGGDSQTVGGWKLDSCPTDSRRREIIVIITELKTLKGTSEGGVPARIRLMWAVFQNGRPCMLLYRDY